MSGWLAEDFELTDDGPCDCCGCIDYVEGDD